ncbi:LPS-assembly protein [Sphingomonas gellani]|uniref:LPS-assembly protein LptD n=1 Tax=Sphingomonas gellani TaxID=1166340 RepID=A0A1H7ZRW5_9SPHN|nr:LPS assembly protein LptD [Sphingomonas gellani]SEM61170.1 LPS-assembly protein [Sphingomonas gellani]
MLRCNLLAGCGLSLALLMAAPLAAQDLQTRPAPLPVAPEVAPADAAPAAAGEDQIRFSSNTLEYDTDSDTVTVTGEVRMQREDERLRADKVVWNRKTGRVVASGNIAVINPQGDVAYGNTIELTDTLKDGVVDNMLVVLSKGGRLAAERGTRQDDGTVNLTHAAYTPCAVTTGAGCPKEPTWKITAVRVTYRPERGRVYYDHAQINLFGLPTIPLPRFSHPVGGSGGNGLLSPDIRYDRVNGIEAAVPYYFGFGPNRYLTVTPHVFSGSLPMVQAEYAALGDTGAFRLTGYATVSRRSDDLTSTGTTLSTEEAFRGYLDGITRYQVDPNWSISGSLRIATDRTFLRRYDISRDDRLRSNLSVERIDADSYFSLNGWFVQTLRLNDRQGLQPIALPEIDYRRRFDEGLLGGRVTAQINSLAITRWDGQDTQRAFASLRWDLRKLTTLGQEVTFTAFARGDLYNTDDTLTSPIVYRGREGFRGRAIGALAVDMRWPFVGSFLGGAQRVTPRLQIVASPRLSNTAVPNEDSRAVDLEDSNLFSLNRFPGYDRFEDSSRATYGLEYALDLPGLTVNATVGQSYRLDERPTILYEGTGLSDRFSDIVGRTELRFRDFVSITHRYRLDKNDLAVRRNEVDATIGSRGTYVLLGYLRLDRNIYPTIEDLQDREEARVAGRVQFARFWSAFGSMVIDLTNKAEDPFSVADGFDPVRHRLGVQYEDDCLKAGLTWRRDYNNTGDARRGNSFLLTLAFTNLGR